MMGRGTNPNSVNFSDSFEVGERKIGRGAPTFIIAEIGANHDRNLDQARELIEAAADAGADAVKFQSFRYEDLYHDPTTSKETREKIKGAQLPFDWHEELIEHAWENDIIFFSTPTHPETIELLEQLDVQLYKIGSSQIVADPWLVRDVLQIGKPVILSTGLGGYGPIERVVTDALEVGNSNVALLHCISEYPTAPEDANIRRIKRLQTAFGTVVGYSDHTLSVDIPAASVALGASIVEKHFTLDRSLSGPDHSFALEPDEFEEMVEAIQDVESALGTGVKLAPTQEEEEIRANIQLKVVLSTDVLSGQSLCPDVVHPRRSPEGIPYRLLNELDDAGVTVKEALPKGTLITWDHLTSSEWRFPT